MDLYKPFDYEPVSIYPHSNGKTVLSRFHWDVLTIWTGPFEDTEKPLVEFTKRVHTPIVKSKSDDVRYLEIEPIPNLQRFEIATLHIPIFKTALASAKFKRKRKGYNNVIQHGGVPKKYLFDLSRVKVAIVVGSSLPKPEELPRTLRDRIW